ncbi:MAG: hypothetical protein M0R75_06440 [Dehalococcoidia bacterium]|nr:hypothetical protein [Dehalococcoidia bacterium]
MTDATIRVHIDSVVLHGIELTDRPALERALATELASQLADSDLTASWHLARGRATPLRGVDAEADAAGLGRELAQSLVALLGQPALGGAVVMR